MRKKTALKSARKKIPRRADYFVYILRCADTTLYTGYTNNLERRLKQHNSGKGARYVRGKTPAELVFIKKYINYKSAIMEEKRIKTLSKKSKEAIISTFIKKDEKLRNCVIASPIRAKQSF